MKYLYTLVSPNDRQSGEINPKIISSEETVIFIVCLDQKEACGPAHF